jgi:hypothetical protein
MRKRLLVTLLIVTLLSIGCYALYRILMPKLIARAVVSEAMPDYIPKRLQARMEAIRTPINGGTEAMVQKMHDSNIPLKEVLDAVDDITEDQAYEFLDEINQKKPSNTDQVFDLAKKHFVTRFDPEVFRKPFNEHFKMKQLNSALAYANMNRKYNDIDIVTAKAILKRIIIEKEREVRTSVSSNQ